MILFSLTTTTGYKTDSSVTSIFTLDSLQSDECLLLYVWQVLLQRNSVALCFTPLQLKYRLFSLRIFSCYLLLSLLLFNHLSYDLSWWSIHKLLDSNHPAFFCKVFSFSVGLSFRLSFKEIGFVSVDFLKFYSCQSCLFSSNLHELLIVCQVSF